MKKLNRKNLRNLYKAIFINRFEQIRGGTRYIVIGCISFKGIVKLLQPFLKGLVKNRIRKFVLEPLKIYAESMKAENNTIQQG
jgi:hypothetical protein